MKRRAIALLCMFCLSVLLACQATDPAPTATAQQMATSTAQLSSTPTQTPTARVLRTATATPQPQVDTWRTIASGVQVRSLDVAVGTATERVAIVRLDPGNVVFQVLYSPGEPRLVSAWAGQTGALLVVNAGYFTPEFRVTGLTISDGQVHGVSYGDYAGMFAVPRQGTASVRWLRASPYDPREPLREAVQCFPVLVKPGGVMGFPADADAGQTTRRTVVAQDRDGRILFLVAPNGYFGLHALAAWLIESDLDIDIALNLDGGPSSGLWVASGSNIDSLVPVPAVIAVSEAFAR
jgi:uncharacterized protein YigE (DUF2233 family)